MEGLIKKNEYEVIKKASFSTTAVIETIASNTKNSKFVSLLDACTCTGNCAGGGGPLSKY